MTKFEEWKASFEQNSEGFREQNNKNGVYDFDKIVKRLQRLQNNMSHDVLITWFGSQIGDHLWEKFWMEDNRNILNWFNKLYGEYRFFIVSELNNNIRWH